MMESSFDVANKREIGKSVKKEPPGFLQILSSMFITQNSRLDNLGIGSRSGGGIALNWHEIRKAKIKNKIRRKK